MPRPALSPVSVALLRAGGICGLEQSDSGDPAYRRILGAQLGEGKGIPMNRLYSVLALAAAGLVTAAVALAGQPPARTFVAVLSAGE